MFRRIPLYRGTGVTLLQYYVIRGRFLVYIRNIRVRIEGDIILYSRVCIRVQVTPDYVICNVTPSSWIGDSVILYVIRFFFIIVALGPDRRIDQNKF